MGERASQWVVSIHRGAGNKYSRKPDFSSPMPNRPGVETAPLLPDRPGRRGVEDDSRSPRGRGPPDAGRQGSLQPGGLEEARAVRTLASSSCYKTSLNHQLVSEAEENGDCEHRSSTIGRR